MTQSVNLFETFRSIGSLSHNFYIAWKWLCDTIKSVHVSLMRIPKDYFYAIYSTESFSKCLVFGWCHMLMMTTFKQLNMLELPEKVLLC